MGLTCNDLPQKNNYMVNIPVGITKTNICVLMSFYETSTKVFVPHGFQLIIMTGFQLMENKGFQFKGFSGFQMMQKKGFPIRKSYRF